MLSNGHYNELEVAMEMQGYNIGPITISKGIIKELMVNTILTFAAKAFAQAVLKNMPEEAKSLDVT